MWKKIIELVSAFFATLNPKPKPEPTPGPVIPPAPDVPVDPNPNPVPEVYEQTVIEEDGKVFGLGYRPDPPDPNDYPWSEYAKLMPLEHMPQQVDHSQFHSKVVSQGSTGSCVGQSCDAAMEYLARVFWNMTGFQGSQSYAYYNARRLEGGAILDNGTYIRLGVKGLFNWGLASSKAWPFDASRINEKPSSEAYADGANLEIRDYLRCENEIEVKSALAQGYPVVVGFDVYETTYNQTANTTGWIAKPSSGMRQRGGHAICLCGYFEAGHGPHGDKGVGYFKFKNSWGTDWGDDGYGYLPFGYGIRDCWAIRPKKEVDPSGNK